MSHLPYEDRKALGLRRLPRPERAATGDAAPFRKSPRYVVIGTSPVVDTAVACGPLGLAVTQAAVLELESRGFVTEVCELLSIRELAELESGPWDGEGDDAP